MEPLSSFTPGVSASDISMSELVASSTRHHKNNCFLLSTARQSVFLAYCLHGESLLGNRGSSTRQQEGAPVGHAGGLTDLDRQADRQAGRQTG